MTKDSARIWSCACHLISMEGLNAVAFALEQMRESHRGGDYVGEDAWYAIAMAASDLQRVRFVGETVH